MCKILVIPGLNPANKELNFNFMAQMADLMSNGNDDGLGYAALDTSGRLFGERWLFNQEAFDQRKSTHTKGRKIDKTRVNKEKMNLGEFVDLEEENDIPSFKKYGIFGEPSDEITAALVHARRATNTVCYENTHPFVDEEREVAVIHNGVIGNHKKEDEIRSTCDSERILNMYLKHGVDKNPMDVQKFIKELDGWFACGIFAKDKNGRNVIDIFRSSTANLGCAFVKELDAMVFSTDVLDIRRACQLMGLTIVSKSKSGVKDDMLLRLDAVTGKMLMSLKYNRWTYHQGNTNFQPVTSDDMYKSMVEQWNENKIAQEKAEEEEAKRRREAWAKRDNVIEADFNRVEARPNETQEVKELERSGATQEEIRETSILKCMDFYKNNNWSEADCRKIATKQVDYAIYKAKMKTNAEMLAKNNNWTAAAVDQYVIHMMKKAVKDGKVEEVSDSFPNIKDIIQANTADPLNENVAQGDNWFMMKESNLWMKRKNGKH